MAKIIDTLNQARERARNTAAQTGQTMCIIGGEGNYGIVTKKKADQEYPFDSVLYVNPDGTTREPSMDEIDLGEDDD